MFPGDRNQRQRHSCFHPEPNPGFHTVVLKLAQATESPEGLGKQIAGAGLPESDTRDLEGRLITGTLISSRGCWPRLWSRGNYCCQLLATFLIKCYWIKFDLYK